MKIDLPKNPHIDQLLQNDRKVSSEKLTKPNKDDDKLRKAAQDFEALFVAQIMGNLRSSISESGLFGSGVSADIYSSMFDRHMSQAIASKGGLHLSDIVINGLQGPERPAGIKSGLELSDYRLQPIRQEINRDSPLDWDRAIIDKAARRYELDPKLLEAVIKVESSNRTNAVSSKGAVGLMQLMKPTAKELGVRNRFDPEENVDGGARYLKRLLNRFNDDLRLALAAYNAGPQAVEKYNGIPPYEETQRYVQKVLKHYEDR